jgi:flagellar hook-length control protein FliK
MRHRLRRKGATRQKAPGRICRIIRAKAGYCAHFGMARTLLGTSEGKSMAGEPVLSAAVATVPSNGPVAPISRATSAPASGEGAFLQLVRTADSAETEQGAVIPADAVQTEAASQTAEAGPPAAARALPEAEGAGTPAPKASRSAKGTSAAATVAAGTADTASFGIAPLPVAVAQPMPPEPRAGQSPPQQDAAASGDTETAAGTTASPGTTAPPGTADRQARPDAAPVEIAPVSAAETTGSAAPAATNRPPRAATLSAESPVHPMAEPRSPAAMPTSLPAEPIATAAAVSPSAAPAHAAPAAVPAPAAQIGSALLTLGPAADGSQQMTLRLHPAELGVVQVQIGRSDTGAAHVEITAEKADTLRALLRDQPQLHRALDDAGVPAAGRTITFHAAPVQSAAGGNGPNLMSPNQGGAGTMSGNSPQGSGKGSYGGGEPGGDSGGRRQTRPPVENTVPATAISFRVGIDIVA